MYQERIVLNACLSTQWRLHHFTKPFLHLLSIMMTEEHIIGVHTEDLHCDYDNGSQHGYLTWTDYHQLLEFCLGLR